ncbi:MAG: putative Ig domain-containing protein, partial [Proteobacteria bacterium]|nr:putative Ig domain-containing protein [Pseudomonadota bacterium]
STGRNHTCAISATSELYCWGAGADGRLGLDDTTDRDTPIRVGADIDWAQVSAGNFATASAHTCAVSTGGQLYCWGESDEGRLGLGSGAEDQDTPTRVGTDDTWSQVSAGTEHTCAVNTGGKLYCWGLGNSGRLGTSSTTNQDTPIRVGDATDWRQVGTGDEHTCAINTGGQLHCWGVNGSGQLGLGDTTNRTAPTRVGTDANWLQVSTGSIHTCAVNDAGQLFCWGFNSSGRLGLGVTTQNIGSPSRVGTDANWLQVSAGNQHTCAVNTGGEFYCWGAGSNGRQGLGALFQTTPATPVGTNWSQISAGGSHTCAVNEIGQLHCWGESDNGRLGLGTTEDRRTPTAVIEPPAPATTIPNLTNVVLTNPDNRFEIAKVIPPIVFTNSGGDVQAGGCAVGATVGEALPAGLRAHPVLIDDTVTCQIIGVPTAVAATSSYGLTATNAAGNNASPATVSFEVFATAPFIANIPTLQIFEKDALIEPITFTNTGLNVQASGCAVDPDLPAGLMLAVYEDAGTMTCQITGTPSTVTARQAYTVTATSSGTETDTATVSIDVRLKILNNASQISTGGNYACAIDSAGQLFCWGRDSGRLGLGDIETSNRNTPHLVGSATDWMQISVGIEHACAINSAGHMHCWGIGDNGQLGLGATSISTIPARVGSDADWTQISAGGFHTCALNSSREIYCWGDGGRGQLGLGDDKVDISTPTQVGDSTDWTQISSGIGNATFVGSHTCAINIGGELYCWGSGSFGQLGTGSTTATATPTRVGSAINWTQVSAGTRHTCAINTAGQLHCWGEIDGGRLGLGGAGTSDITTPTRVGMAADWTQVSAGDRHTCAINSVGQLHCWGASGVGQLGLGDITTAPTPTRVGNATNWTQVILGLNHTCAISSSDQLHCWGDGRNGRLGLGDEDGRTTPEAVTPAP